MNYIEIERDSQEPWHWAHKQHEPLFVPPVQYAPPCEVAPRSLMVKLPWLMRRAYRGRPITPLAAQCLLNECIRQGGHQQGRKSAHPAYIEPTVFGQRSGRKRIA